MLAIDDPHDVCFAETSEHGVGSGGRVFVSDNSRIYELDLDDAHSGASVLCGGLVSFSDDNSAPGEQKQRRGVGGRGQRQGQRQLRQEGQQSRRDLGKPLRGYRDGNLAEALFDRPDGLAFDAESSIL